MDGGFFSQTILVQTIIGFVLAAIMAVLSYKLRALTISGSVGMVIVGSIVFGMGGVLYAVPLIVFFITSSLLSFVKSGRKSEALLETGKTGPRDIRQVLANGGAAALIVIIYALTKNEQWYFIYLAAIAEAAADTWATEIGTLSSKKPVMITSFKPVDPGRSGGITLPGTISSLTGAAVIVLSGLAAAEIYGRSFDIGAWIWILAVLAGWAGAIFDSILGATIQAQYKCRICGKITEKEYHCRRETILHGGIRIIDNDAVNFISTLIAALLVLAFS